MESNLELLVFLSLFTVYKFKHNYISVILILSGLVTMLFPQWLNPYFTIPGDLYAITCMGAKAVAFAIILLSIDYRRWMLEMFVHLSIVSCLIMFFNFFRINSAWGLNFNSSMDGTLLAVTYPIILMWCNSKFNKAKSYVHFIIPILYIIIPIIAVFASRSSIGIGGICLGLSVIYLRSHWKLIFIPLSLFAISYFINPDLLDENNRVKCWVWSMNWWWDNANHWFGTGLGTYGLLGPMIQVITGNNILASGLPQQEYYYEMHNDWLQLVFELGYVGLAAGLLTVRDLIKRSWERPHLLASVCVYAAVSGMNYPSHATMTALFAVILIKAIDNN